MSQIRSDPMAEGQPIASGDPAADPSPASVPADVAVPAGRPHWVTFLGLASLIITADQLTKAWLVSFLAPGQSVAVLGDWIRLVHSQNNGGLFGLLRGQAVPFGLVSLVVVGLIVLYHARAEPNRYVSITLGLLLGGAIGNLIDRLRINYVVDFVDAGIGSLRWYTFNIADSAITFAILLLLAASLWPSVARRAGVDA
ncbi:MAG: signal peptidase II [Chloroflexi bacterium]|nr:signal peptidase II [Chloroflexota bacterium]